jgi:hypothetical protein
MGQIAVGYAVLWHGEIAEPHFDLLIETCPGSELATWRSAVWPIESTVDLLRVKDHRRIYLQYEGDLTERRGRVERVAGGSCEVEIGENAVWKIRFLNLALTLVLKQVDGAKWMGGPLGCE